MIVQNQNNLINVVIYFVQLVLINIFNQLNLNVHVVLQFMENFEVEFIVYLLYFSFFFITGNQPDNGTMSIDTSKHRLPGYEHDSRGTIRITYNFPNGIQDVSH